MAASRWARLYGPWALVTGASDGIGAAIAADAARRGLNLVLVARRADRLEALAARLTERHRVQCRVIPADLADPDAPAVLEAQTQDLDIGLLVAAAGFGTAGDFTAIDPASEAEMLAVNCHAPMMLARLFAPRLVARAADGKRRGGIILFGSIVGFQGVARSAHYAATKAYNQVLAEGLHRELRPHGVDVLAVAPGPVATGFAARSNLDMQGAPPPGPVARETLSALGRKVTVRPGFRSKLLGYGLATLPRVARSAILSSVMQGMTRHHDSDAIPSAP